MNGFLVMGRTNLDDCPLGLFETKGEASTFAAQVTGSDVHDNALNVMGVDHAGLINVGIVEFKNGVPQPIELGELAGET